MNAGRALLAAVIASLLVSASPVDAGTEPPATPPTTTPTETVANPFLPEDERVSLSDCVSVVPRPECGSKARGGWRQGLVFGALVAGMGVIGVRLAVGVRRRNRPET